MGFAPTGRHNLLRLIGEGPPSSWDLAFKQDLNRFVRVRTTYVNDNLIKFLLRIYWCPLKRTCIWPFATITWASHTISWGHLLLVSRTLKPPMARQLYARELIRTFCRRFCLPPIHSGKGWLLPLLVNGNIRVTLQLSASRYPKYLYVGLPWRHVLFGGTFSLEVCFLRFFPLLCVNSS